MKRVQRKIRRKDGTQRRRRKIRESEGVGRGEGFRKRRNFSRSLSRSTRHKKATIPKSTPGVYKKQIRCLLPCTHFSHFPLRWRPSQPCSSKKQVRGFLQAYCLNSSHCHCCIWPRLSSGADCGCTYWRHSGANRLGIKLKKRAKALKFFFYVRFQDVLMQVCTKYQADLRS